ncbi:MAG: sporulation transcription factor Spo0A [Bacillota bacterium]
MAENIKVGLADNNKDLCISLSEHITMQEDMELAGVAYHGVAALEMVSSYDLDVLLLDITMPYLDGIGVLEKMNQMNLSKRPKVIVITAIEQENMVKKLFGLGVDYYLIKPFSIETLLERIRQFGPSMQTTAPASGPSSQTASSDKTEFDLDMSIARIFHEMGIPVNLRGYAYLREAVHQMLENDQTNWSVTKLLYPQIAQKFHCTPSGVESAIRYILDMVWERGNVEYLSSFFRFPKSGARKQPTTSQFLSRIVEHLRMSHSLAQNI